MVAVSSLLLTSDASNELPTLKTAPPDRRQMVRDELARRLIYRRTCAH